MHRAALVVQSIAGSAEAPEALGPERPPGADFGDENTTWNRDEKS